VNISRRGGGWSPSALYLPTATVTEANVNYLYG
jgi:hypothetical protein